MTKTAEQYLQEVFSRVQVDNTSPPQPHPSDSPASSHTAKKSVICVWLKANFHLVGDILVSRSTFSRAWASIFLSPAKSAVYVAHLGLGLGLLEEGAVGARDVHLSSTLNSHTHWSRLLSP